MGIFSLLLWFRSGKTAIEQERSISYIPDMFEDDYCDIELLPIDNQSFIRRALQEITGMTDGLPNYGGYNKPYARGDLPLRPLPGKYVSIIW